MSQLELVESDLELLFRAAGALNALRAGCSRLGVDAQALGEWLARLEKLIEALYEYVEWLGES